MKVPRSLGWAVPWFTLALLVIHATQVGANSYAPKLSEVEQEFPFCCPYGCGGWCDEGQGCDKDPALDFSSEDEGGDDTDGGDATKTPLARDFLMDGSCDMGNAASDFPDVCNGTDVVLEAHVRRANDDILKDELTNPDDWPGGSKDWWDKMDGLIATRGLRFCYNALSTAITHHIDADPNGRPRKESSLLPLGAGAPTVRGCTILVAMSNLGVAVVHIWEVPTFVKPIRYRGFDEEGQKEGYRANADEFLRQGHQFYDRVPAKDGNPARPAAPDSPPFADLFKPGMILDKHSTKWRKFRLFHPRKLGLQSSKSTMKNEEQMEKFHLDLSRWIGVHKAELAVHSPLYQPHQSDAWNLEPHTNRFTWQFAPKEPLSNAVGSVNSHAFRVTFNGEEILEMAQKWLPTTEWKAVGVDRLVDQDNMCRLEVKYDAVPVDGDNGPRMESLNLQSVKVFHPDQQQAYSDSGSFDLTADGEEFTIFTSKSGTNQEVRFSFSDGAEDNWFKHGGRPQYDSWHITAVFGETQQYEYLGDGTSRGIDQLPLCRGGSWKRESKDAKGYTRTANCHYYCEISG